MALCLRISTQALNTTMVACSVSLEVSGSESSEVTPPLHVGIVFPPAWTTPIHTVASNQEVVPICARTHHPYLRQHFVGWELALYQQS